MAKPRLAPIYERLAGAPQYHPMNAETFADWSLEAGDIVTVKREGTEYSSPVQTVRMKWNGVPTTQIESVGEKKRESIAKMSAQKYARGAGGGGGVRNSHYQHLFVQDAYGRMQSGLELTGSTAHLYARDLYAQMESGLALTTSSAHLYVDDKYNQMSSGLALTSSSAHLYVDDRYNQMSSGLSLTSSSAALYVDDKYNQMKSGLDLTTSSAHLYVDDKYNQMSSGLKLTSSSAALYVDNKYNQMKSGLDLTASSAALYVDNKYNQMKSGLSITMSSAVMYARSKDAAAEIVARINEDNESEIKLDAQHVYIGNQKSTTVINGKLNASDVTAEYLNSKIATIPTLTGIAAQFSGNVSASGIIARDGLYLNDQSLADGLKAVQVVPDGNQYKLQYQEFGSSGWHDASTFSRATTLSGAWSSGKFTVSASPQGNSFWTDLVQGSVTWDGKVGTIPINASDSTSGGRAYFTGRNISVDATSVYNNGSPASGSAGSRSGSTYNWSFIIKRGDGTTKTLTIDCTSIYADARSGYTLGTFTQATVTLQGSSQSVYVPVSSGGTNYYKAGTAVTYYKSGNTYTYYTSGTNVVRYTISNGKRLKDDGTARHYDVNGNLIGNFHWYHEVTSGGSYYYNASRADVIEQGTAVDITLRGDAVTVTPISGSALMLAATTRYAAGSTDSTTYYKKS